MKLSWRSLSLVGLAWPFSQKVTDTSKMIFQIVPKPRYYELVPKIVLAGEPWQRLWWSCFVEISWRSQGRYHCWCQWFQGTWWISAMTERGLCMLLVTAPSREVSATMQSAMSWFCWAVVLFENAVEAERGKFHGGFGLVRHQNDQSHARERQQRSSLVLGITGSIPLCPLWGRGWRDVAPSQCRPSLG